MLPEDKLNSLNILHLSTYDTNRGAARAAYRLHKGLIRLGHDSSMFVEQRYSDDPTVIKFKPPTGFINRLYRLLRRELINKSFGRYQHSRPVGYEIFSDDRSQYGSHILNQIPGRAIINLHWIARFVDYISFLKPVATQTPTVWTLHDMNAFTGGCHYSNGCAKYKIRCGSCPQLGSNRASDLSRRVWKRKHAIFSRIKPERLHIVAPSQWMASKAKNSKLLNKFPVTIIPYGLDTSVFSPRDRQLARDSLEVPRDAQVVLFVADSVSNHRKGFKLLQDALRGIKDIRNLFLMSIGNGKLVVENQIPNIHLGHINNDRILSLIYSAADLFVIPSLEDNLPNTVLESMACGTPVVGFDVGGIPDMVRLGETGLLTPQGDISALRTAIVNLFQDSEKLKMMAVNCYRIAVKEYSLKVQAKRYHELYIKILSESKFA